MYFLGINVSFIDSSFINNTSYSVLENSHGGSISITEASGFCINCSFNNNKVESYSNKHLISKMEPRSLGGAVRLNQTSFHFFQCSFISNVGFGYSPNSYSTGKGGALYSIDSNINISHCIFVNNSLANKGGYYNSDCYIEGGACYFLNSNINISDCKFIKNSATLNASIKSNEILARIYGGAICYFSTNQLLKCNNCLLENNIVSAPLNQQKEFAGALCLTNGIINNCSFIENKAYNGDIRYNQNMGSILKVLNCTFQHNELSKHELKSLIHLRGSFNISSFNVFSNNIVFINITTVLFDGMMTLNNNESKIVKYKFRFSDNCIYPFQENIFISEKIQINDETGINNSTLYTSFESECYINTETETEQIKTSIESDFMSTEQIKITTHNFITQAANTKSMSSSISQIDSLPISHTNKDSKVNILQFKNILIIQTAIISFLTILILVILVLLIYFIKKNQNNNRTSLNTSLIELT